MEKIYNKLVRDNIPDIIEKDNETPYIRILSDDEFIIELKKKIIEEAQEVFSSTDEEIMGELADVYEILNELAIRNGKTIEDVQKLALAKKNKRGGFSKKIYLEKTIRND